MGEHNHLVIMAGGVGSRFWPMSTPEKPKQFVDVMGCGRSLIQLTFDRFKPIISAKNMWVVTSAKYLNIVREQLPEIPWNHVLLEPCRRNTAPCIAYASWRIKAQDPKANVVVAPSDAIVMDVVEFQRVVNSCLKFVAESDAMVTLGMKPTRPETGYGYIQADLSCSTARNKEVFRVDSFKEKPDIDTANLRLERRHHCQCLASLPANPLENLRGLASHLRHRKGTRRDKRGLPPVREHLHRLCHHGESRGDLRLPCKFRLERPWHLGLASREFRARHLRKRTHRREHRCLRNH